MAKNTWHPSRLAPASFRRHCAAAYVSLPPTSNFGVTGRRDRRSGVPAERHILPLHFSDGGFLPKAATLRHEAEKSILPRA